jgi:hypothetical protein
VARRNGRDEWVVSEQPELRIVSDELWAAVKRRQMEVEKSFSRTTTNRLNKAHRPHYLLSGILERAHCLGPYAIMAKDRYGCTNRQKKLPIEHLGGIVCTNSKTISRFELEERVVAAVPDNLLGTDNPDRINRDIATATTRGQERASVEPGRLRSEITAIETKQRAIGEKIADRLVAGHTAIPALDHMLDELERQRLALAGQAGRASGNHQTSHEAAIPQRQSFKKRNRGCQDHSGYAGELGRRDLDIDRSSDDSEGGHHAVKGWKVGGSDDPRPRCCDFGSTEGVAGCLARLARPAIGGIRPQTCRRRVQVFGGRLVKGEDMSDECPTLMWMERGFRLLRIA